MTSITTTEAIVIYLAITAVTAAAMFAATGHARPSSAPAVRHRGLICVAAGAFWPLLWIGAAEFAMVGATHRAAARRRQGRAPLSVGGRHRLWSTTIRPGKRERVGLGARRLVRGKRQPAGVGLPGR